MRARPRVAYTVPQSPEEVFERFRETLEGGACPCDGMIGRQEVTLQICDAHRRLWSPFLQLGVEVGEDGQTVVRGVMGPAPNLWTAFVFVYAVHLVVFVSGTMYGFVQATLNDTPTGLLAAGGALLGLACSCGLDLTGRRLGQGQMGIIRGMVVKTLPGAREMESPMEEGPVAAVVP
ncbi:MAG: hypothetical protein KC656_03525 [Myxococcales bacterium]|nr:hypothetical protein [Myxococcales bacterium]MCB9671588.1 hypothetical protein [Alphaproteobacteria bacterium]MCB9691822.1 hypothetical protein [Alphaproteobacteria bacterium]